MNTCFCCHDLAVKAVDDGRQVHATFVRSENADVSQP